MSLNLVGPLFEYALGPYLIVCCNISLKPLSSTQFFTIINGAIMLTSTLPFFPEPFLYNMQKLQGLLVHPNFQTPCGSSVVLLRLELLSKAMDSKDPYGVSNLGAPC